MLTKYSDELFIYPHRESLKSNPYPTLACYLLNNLIGHCQDVRLLLPKQDEAFEPVYEAGEPHGVALVDQQVLRCGQKCWCLSL